MQIFCLIYICLKIYGLAEGNKAWAMLLDPVDVQLKLTKTQSTGTWRLWTLQLDFLNYFFPAGSQSCSPDLSISFILVL